VSTSALKDRITEDMKAAMRAKQGERLSTIRMLLAACKQREVDDRVELDDAAIVAIVDRLIKQRRDSITAFRQGGRDDLVAKESAEVEVLQAYLPARLDDAALSSAVALLIERLQAKGAADMGRVMAAAKSELSGQADMGAVSRTVKQLLQTVPGGQP
jgi:uncharacterized protein